MGGKWKGREEEEEEEEEEGEEETGKVSLFVVCGLGEEGDGEDDHGIVQKWNERKKKEGVSQLLSSLPSPRENDEKQETPHCPRGGESKEIELKWGEEDTHVGVPLYPLSFFISLSLSLFCPNNHFGLRRHFYLHAFTSSIQHSRQPEKKTQQKSSFVANNINILTPAFLLSFPGGGQHHWQEGRDRQAVQGRGKGEIK